MIYTLEVSSQKSEERGHGGREEESDKSIEAMRVALFNIQQISANNMRGQESQSGGATDSGLSDLHI